MMARQNVNYLRFLGLLAIVVGSASAASGEDMLCADQLQQASATAAIRELDGTARLVDGAWEIDFSIRGRRFNDAGLMQIVQLRPIVWLNLKRTRVTDQGLAQLQKIRSLRVLNLAETKISDDGLRHLKSLKNLEHLNVHGTRVTDRGLELLGEFKKLKKLYVWKTSVTEAGILRLRQKLPELKIVRGVDLKAMESRFPAETKKEVPRVALQWMPIQSRDQAPQRSENGVNCEILFENRLAEPVKLYWIMYGSGDLKLYGTVKPNATRRQNSYSQNAWLITDVSDRPLGYFIARDEDSHAVVPDK